MEKINWTDRAKSKCIIYRQGEKGISYIKRRNANCIGHVFRWNCILKHVIEGKIEGRIKVTGRRVKRRRQMTDDLKEKKGYWRLTEEELDRTLWRTLFGRNCGHVRQNAEGMTGKHVLQKSSKNYEVSGNTTRRCFTESTTVAYHLP
jgi:hypothetical protein